MSTLLLTACRLVLASVVANSTTRFFSDNPGPLETRESLLDIVIRFFGFDLGRHVQKALQIPLSVVSDISTKKKKNIY